MNISNIAFILILCTVSFITYIVCSYTLNCDINCQINYNKIENRTDTRTDDYDNQLANQIMINDIKKKEIQDMENKIHNTKKFYKKMKKQANLASNVSVSNDDYIENLLFS